MQSVTYFISDLHLSADRPDITACFIRFLQNEAPGASALYILGDLFEAWIGDDDINPFTNQIANALRELANTGTPIWFIHGNRDFLLGKRYAKRSGMTLLPENHVIDLYGTPTLIMHGDELCTMDVAYQQFRRKARGWWWPRMIKMLPLSVRRRIAEKGRQTSATNKSQLNQTIMDVTPDEVLQVMAAANVTQLIHGHTHRPAVHNLTIQQQNQQKQSAQRIVLGDWYTQGSVLKVTPQEMQLSRREFSPEA